MPRRGASVRIKAFSRQCCVDLASISDVQDRWERVCEIENEQGADEAGDAVEVGHGGGDDECDDPVDGAEGVPEELAFLGGDLRPFEDFLADFDIHGFHSDVEV